MWLGIFTRNPLLEWSKLIECLQIPKLMSHKNVCWCWWSSLGSSSIDKWSHIPSPCGAALLPLPLGTGHETYIILQHFVLDFFFFWFIFVPFFFSLQVLFSLLIFVILLYFVLFLKYNMHKTFILNNKLLSLKLIKEYFIKNMNKLRFSNMFTFV